jgi:alkylation response protein AidB-like acyl-CoA dehydrogenase
MRFLERERKALAEYFPGLDERIAAIPLFDMEKPGNPAIALYREWGGPGLLIPRQFGGRGADPVEAVRIQRALGARAPSLAIAATMHQFSVATIVAMAATGGEQEATLLSQIAGQQLYVASGVAEGRSGSSALSSSVVVKASAHGLTLSGSKKPCSLSRSMDLLTASMRIPDELDHAGEFAMAIIPAASAGIDRRPFWSSPVLAGAESDEILLSGVAVPRECIFCTGGPEQMALILGQGFFWFELLVCATYLGIASGLAERTLLAKKGTATERAALGTELEAAMTALEGIGACALSGAASEDLLARTMFVRFAVQQAIERASALAVELLGGIAFVRSPEIGYLYAASRALAFHPPSRLSMAPALDAYLAGETLALE